MPNRDTIPWLLGIDDALVPASGRCAQGGYDPVPAGVLHRIDSADELRSVVFDTAEDRPAAARHQEIAAGVAARAHHRPANALPWDTRTGAP
jgi:hypothetical protein